MTVFRTIVRDRVLEVRLSPHGDARVLLNGAVVAHRFSVDEPTNRIVLGISGRGEEIDAFSLRLNWSGGDTGHEAWLVAQVDYETPLELGPLPSAPPPPKCGACGYPLGGLLKSSSTIACPECGRASSAIALGLLSEVTEVANDGRSEDEDQGRFTHHGP